MLTFRLLPFALLTFLFHTSYGQSTIKKDGTSPQVLEWKFNTNAPIFSSPVVSAKSVFIGSLDSNLYALDIETGKIQWKLKIGGPIRSTVFIEKNKLFLLGGDGTFYAVDKNSGKVLWKFSTGGEKTYEPYGYADYFHSAPFLSNGVVYFGSGDGGIYAVKAGDGTLLWKYQTGSVVHSAPILHNDTLYAGSFDGYLYALDSQKGTLLWKFKSVGHRFFPRGEMQGSPVFSRGIIFIGSRDYNLYAIDAEKRYCHWNKQFPKGWALALTAADSVLYVGTSDDDLMIAVDAETGKELWRADMKFNIFGPPAATPSMLYFGTLQGKMFGLDAKTGDICWSFNTDGYTAHHADYFKSETEIVKNEFYAIVQTPEGYIDALCKLGAIFSTPAITDRYIIFSSADGTLYCLKRQ